MISAETYNADYERAVKFGYDKGIDEFAEKCKANILCKTFGLREVDIDKIAEQLKGDAE